MNRDQLFIQKLAAIPTSLGGLKSLAKNNPKAVGALVGGAGATALQYMRNRKKNGGKTTEEEIAASRLQKAKAGLKEGDPSMGKELELAKAKSNGEIAKLMAKYPFRGALLAAPAGATLGAGVVGLGQRLSKLAK